MRCRRTTSIASSERHSAATCTPKTLSKRSSPKSARSSATVSNTALPAATCSSFLRVAISIIFAERSIAVSLPSFEPLADERRRHTMAASHLEHPVGRPHVQRVDRPGQPLRSGRMQDARIPASFHSQCIRPAGGDEVIVRDEAQSRREAKNARSRSAPSSASSPPATSGRWLSRGSASTSSTLPAAPAFGSGAA